MTLKDLANFKGSGWSRRAFISRRRHLELPPPSQAWATNEYLNILQACLPQWARASRSLRSDPRIPNTGT